MNISQIEPQIRYVGVNDRTTTRFEALWSLPHGVSYNAYLVIGEDKIALIDTVEASFSDRFLQNIEHELCGRKIDYLVVNHMEPDHSSSINTLRRIYPDVEIVGNSKTIQMLSGYYGVCDHTIEVKEGETLQLGGLTLAFALIPMVHWPETMVTYCPEYKTLFSGDAFGTFGTLDGGVTDSQLKLDHFWDEMRRYYACIVGKYGAPVQKALAKVRTLDIETICPTHGPVWQRECARVIDLYDRMSRYEGEPGVVIAYGSMYGNTEQMADQIARQLAEQQVGPIVIYNLSTADKSVVLSDIFKYNTLVVGSPTYNGELFPEVHSLLHMLEERNITNRNFAYFGSFTWASGAVKHMQAFAERMKWKTPCTPVELKQGYNHTTHANNCQTLACEVATMMK